MIDAAIIGAPKCGTSSLFSWLSAHPMVAGTQPKETYYFIDKDHPMYGPSSNFHAQGWNGFAAYLPGDTQGKIRLEATAHNLYQQTALDAFSALTPQPLIICVLRRPEEQIRSSFYFARNSFEKVDQAISFPVYVEHLLSGQMDKLRGTMADERTFQLLSSALEHADYARWLDRWRARFPPDRIVLIPFQELSNAPRLVVQLLCRRLGIDPAFYENFEFDAKNRTLHYRSESIHRFVRLAARLIPDSNIRQLLQWTYRKVQRRTSPTAKQDTPDNKALTALRSRFNGTNDELFKAYGIDISTSG